VTDIRLVRKMSRRRRKLSLYEYERFMVNIPRDYHEKVREWSGRDLKMSVESFDKGFLVMAYTEDKYIDGWNLQRTFEDFVRNKLGSKS